MATGNKRHSAGLDGDALLMGFTIGLAAGAVGALLNVLQARYEAIGQKLLKRLETVAPADPIAESIAEGKAAARRRQFELGLNR